MKSKIKKKNIRNFLIATLFIIVAVCFLFNKSIIVSAQIIQLGNDFQYNLLSFSGVIAGFLFTGVGILISAIDKERIKRLWKHSYLDDIYYCSIFGIFSNIINVICVLILVMCNIKNSNVKDFLIQAEIVLTSMGVIYFIWSTLKLMKLVSLMKDS